MGRYTGGNHSADGLAQVILAKAAQYRTAVGLMEPEQVCHSKFFLQWVGVDLMVVSKVT